MGVTSTGTPRDTLGVLVTSVTPEGPAARAGLAEGTRIAAIDGVSLRTGSPTPGADPSGPAAIRLTRELATRKPGDEVELRVYGEGRTSTVRVRTADADSLRRLRLARLGRSRDERPSLGVGIGAAGSRRDTLGVFITSVADSGAAARAGLEEGMRIAAVDGVSLRVAREEAGDRWAARARAERLRREIARHRPGERVTLRVYDNGQWRDVALTLSRAAEMRAEEGFDVRVPPVPPVAPWPSLPAWSGGRVAAPAAPSGVRDPAHAAPSPHGEAVPPPVEPEEDELGWMVLDRIRPQLDRLRPQLDRLRREMPRLRRLREVGLPFGELIV